MSGGGGERRLLRRRSALAWCTTQGRTPPLVEKNDRRYQVRGETVFRPPNDYTTFGQDWLNRLPISF